MCSARNTRVMRARFRCRPTVRNRGQPVLWTRRIERIPSTTTALRRTRLTAPAPRVVYQRSVLLKRSGSARDSDSRAGRAGDGGGRRLQPRRGAGRRGGRRRSRGGRGAGRRARRGTRDRVGADGAEEANADEGAQRGAGGQAVEEAHGRV